MTRGLRATVFGSSGHCPRDITIAGWMPPKFRPRHSVHRQHYLDRLGRRVVLRRPTSADHGPGQHVLNQNTRWSRAPNILDCRAALPTTNEGTKLVQLPVQLTALWKRLQAMPSESDKRSLDLTRGEDRGESRSNYGTMVPGEPNSARWKRQYAGHHCRRETRSGLKRQLSHR